MSDELKISVVIPTYNRADCLGEAIQSVLNQTYPALEIIVVDDGSTDNTKQLVESFGSRVKYHHIDNGGPARARNFGIHKSSGDWIAFLDSDDRWLAYHLELKAKFISKNPDACLVSSLGLVDESVARGSCPDSVEVQEIPFRKMLIKNFVGVTPAVMVRKRPLLQMKAFDETLKICEDYDLWLRLALMKPLHKIMHPTVSIKLRTDGLSAGDRESTNRKYAAFIQNIFQNEFRRFRRYENNHLSLFYYECCVDYTEQRQFARAFYYLWLSCFYNPLWLPLAKKPLTRTRRFFVLIKECLKRG